MEVDVMFGMTVYDKDGNVVNPGQILTTEEGDRYMLLSPTFAHRDGHCGRVCVGVVEPEGVVGCMETREMYDTVLGCVVKEHPVFEGVEVSDNNGGCE